MRKTVLGFAVGFAAMAMSAEAGACSYAYRNYAEEPYMARFVREAAFIDLVRVTGATPLLPDARGVGPAGYETYSYSLEVVERVKGNSPRNILIRAADAINDLVAENCDTDDLRPAIGEDDEFANSDAAVEVASDCRDAIRQHKRYLAYQLFADNGRANWSMFHHSVPGSADGPPPQLSDPHVRGWSSCTLATSLEVGATYLVFRDENGDPLYGNGLNFQEIRRDDDAWLSAVRYFIAHPEESWLPPIPAETVLDRYNQVAVASYSHCPANIPPHYNSHHPSSEIGEVELVVRGQSAEWVPTNYVDFARNQNWADNVSCDQARRFMFLTLTDTPAYSRQYMPALVLPIRDDRVDFSGIPSQYRIEPLEAPLEDVISWLSEETDDE